MSDEPLVEFTKWLAEGKLVAWGSISMLDVRVEVYSDDGINVVITDPRSGTLREVVRHPLSALKNLEATSLLELVLEDIRTHRNAKRPSDSRKDMLASPKVGSSAIA